MPTIQEKAVIFASLHKQCLKLLLVSIYFHVLNVKNIVEQKYHLYKLPIKKRPILFHFLFFCQHFVYHLVCHSKLLGKYLLIFV